MSVKDILREGLESVSDEDIYGDGREEDFSVSADMSFLNYGMLTTEVSDILGEVEEDGELTEKEKELYGKIAKLVALTAKNSGAVYMSAGTEGFIDTIRDTMTDFQNGLRKLISVFAGTVHYTKIELELLQKQLNTRGEDPRSDTIHVGRNILAWLADGKQTGSAESLEGYLKFIGDAYNSDQFFDYIQAIVEGMIDYNEDVSRMGREGMSVKTADLEAVWEKRVAMPIVKDAERLQKKFGLKRTSSVAKSGYAIYRSDATIGGAHFRCEEAHVERMQFKTFTASAPGKVAPTFVYEGEEVGSTAAFDVPALTNKEVRKAIIALRDVARILQKARAIEASLIKNLEWLNKLTNRFGISDQGRTAHKRGMYYFGDSQQKVMPALKSAWAVTAMGPWMTAYSAEVQSRIMAHLSSVCKAEVAFLRKAIENLEGQ